MENKLFFAKVKPNAIIPTKENEDLGYDIYACTEEEYIIIPPHKTILIPTGIASSCDPNYGIILKDRGSNGSKGIHVYAGVIDSGYRDEWFVAWHNSNDIPVALTNLSKPALQRLLMRESMFIVKNLSESMNDISPYQIQELFEDIMSVVDKKNELIKSLDSAIFYPMSKAICQAIIVDSHEIDVNEIPYEELKAIPSKRGTGKLGSSNK